MKHVHYSSTSFVIPPPFTYSPLKSVCLDSPSILVKVRFCEVHSRPPVVTFGCQLKGTMLVSPFCVSPELPGSNIAPVPPPPSSKTKTP